MFLVLSSLLRSVLALIWIFRSQLDQSDGLISFDYDSISRSQILCELAEEVVLTWRVLNFGWIHSPARQQPVPTVRNGVNNTCAKDIACAIPGYQFRAADLTHLAVDTLLRFIRYTEGYVDPIDMDKT